MSKPIGQTFYNTLLAFYRTGVMEAKPITLYCTYNRPGDKTVETLYFFEDDMHFYCLAGESSPILYGKPLWSRNPNEAFHPGKPDTMCYMKEEGKPCEHRADTNCERCKKPICEVEHTRYVSNFFTDSRVPYCPSC